MSSELVKLYKNGEEALVEKGSEAEAEFIKDGWAKEAKPKRKPRKKVQSE